MTVEEKARMELDEEEAAPLRLNSMDEVDLNIVVDVV